ncbi:helix-turn-helix domain-containing protein [Flagellimonas olearia]|uniref:Helix-turn-helix domain-containing protein n=1 Tax=Flagellimonas olearia TaxID=552546 RepID=A0A6I1E0H3_9FLAO|nr:helix-turn-helix transcriptional regulator [Allomuricauda olearia]KAB7530647.1 helix-turn-helix domain-containing protein [Allomuricauda olearia]
MNKDVIPRIQTIMDHYGLTVSAFADEIGVQRSSVSHLLNGRNKPSLDFVMKLVDTYPEVNLYWLLKGVGEFPSSIKEGEIKKEIAVPGKTKSDQAETEFNSIAQDKDTLQPIKVIVFYADGTFESFQAKKD